MCHSQKVAVRSLDLQSSLACPFLASQIFTNLPFVIKKTKKLRKAW